MKRSLPVADDTDRRGGTIPLCLCLLCPENDASAHSLRKVRSVERWEYMMARSDSVRLFCCHVGGKVLLGGTRCSTKAQRPSGRPIKESEAKKRSIRENTVKSCRPG